LVEQLFIGCKNVKMCLHLQVIKDVINYQRFDSHL